MTAAACSLLVAVGVSAKEPVAAARRVKRLVVCDDISDPATLDPHKQFAEKNHTILQQIYEGLVRFDPQGKIEPALAVSWRRIDPLRMRFSLRRDVRFHNGEPFDADCVRATIARYLDPRTGFPALGMIATIARAEVVDGHTVDIVTHQPDGLLLHRLAGFVLIIPHRQLAAIEIAPVGTGAFRFEEWRRGDRIVLEANRDYWSENEPKVDKLVFRFIPAKEQIAELFAGNVDALFDVPGTMTLAVQRHPETRILKGRAYSTMGISLRFDKGVLADRRIRQALNYATDRKALIRYDLLGNGTPIATLSMPGEEGHNPDLEPYPYDPRKAAALLAEAGHADGIKLTAMVLEGAERTARILAADWQRVGIDLKFETMKEHEILAFFKDPKYDLAIGECPDPMAHSYFIQALAIFSKSPRSLARDEKFDVMLERMASTIDNAERQRQAMELDRYIYAQALSVFTYQRRQTYALRNGVTLPHYVTGMPYLFAADVPQ
ncbi:MAG: ABC transporter substrate-binding protein [Elusimicrobiota bacterium]